jgi:acyl carrier protein
MDENAYEAPQSSDEARGRSRPVIVFALLTIGAAYFSVVIPLVLSGRLDRAWAIAPASLAVVSVLAYFFDPNLRAERRYKTQLKERKPVVDEELFEAYFSEKEVARDIPARVRAIMAKHMQYPAERMLPDDDLTFFWYDLDGVVVIQELEEQFGIEITEADAERTVHTIRDISHLVHQLR